MDGDTLLRLTTAIERCNQLLARLRADMAACDGAPAGDAVLLRRVALRIDDATARLHGLTADLALWHTTLLAHAAGRPLVGPA